MNATSDNPGRTNCAVPSDNPQPEAGVQVPQVHPPMMPVNGDERSFLRGAISVFILFNLVAIFSWAVPLNVPPLREIKQIVRPYLLWSGLFQSWDFFAPNPRPVNSYIQAVVVTEDRHMRVFDFPRMEQLSYSKRYREERYRKFAEVLSEPAYAALWPDVARRIARMLNSAGDPPRMVILMKSETPIEYVATEQHVPVPKPQFFYEYYVSGEDLR
ncbi:MAG: hypothetical protein ACRD28_09675 [Acidobacteriaceae bacterium]